MPRVAIVIVTYDSADVIGPCLDSIAQWASVESDAEVIVIDNASSDSTCGKVAATGVRLIANPGNAGFAAAVNQGVQATSAPLTLLLNPDTRLETGLEPLIRCFDDPRTGGAGGLLLGSGGKPQTGFMARNLPTPAALVFEALGINRIWPNNPVNWQYRCLGKNPMASAFVDQPAGAFFMFRRSGWEQLGGFDANFWPVWFEDVDFCARLRSAGFWLRYEPDARAFHRGGHAVGRIAPGSRERYWYGSLLKYAAKHYRPVAFGSVCLAVAAGAAGRALLAFPRAGLSAFEVYSSVIRLSFAHLRGALPGSRIPGPRRGK
jgi:N-acetylglucosaminyl-diphospho-decaprenol L-rhamnosyltransferase